MTTYLVGYISSNGQPVNGYTTHTNKRKAIAQAMRFRADALIANSGGKAFVEIDHGPELEHERVWEWYEHAEGGYRTI
jgi:hypothetical protein